AKLEEIERLVFRPEGKMLLAKVKERRQLYVTSFSRVVDLTQDDRRRDEALQIMQAETMPALRSYEGSLRELADFQRRMMGEAAAEAKQEYTSARGLMLLLGALAILAGLTMS